ncbi:hypothetical protein DLD77_00880 [Chitinophaga alhagiae]|uniref:DUF2249 domain-containing protein n=1 Tax=Chitinophaga alhagiae TaxID=2203219 RepID=A0ABM6W8W3_9BACT|nr:DUF2249 domain-containing protein [Chitinophaga alhagiae]AWO00361.1 hypothetical protein DLD77_00880 [Chitinophaga alhagiae]
MVINARTRIAAILKHHPAALEAIISISPKFEKLRNPLLRKLIAGRATVAMASKIGGCPVGDFFAKLRPLGFDIDLATPAGPEEKQDVPGFLKTVKPDQVVLLDVRPVLALGQDPLNIILEKVRHLQSGQVLKIQNTFEPTPLMLLLQKQGFASYAEQIDDNLVETFFYRTSAEEWHPAPTAEGQMNWDNILRQFKGKLKTIDVRHLEMPLPMLTILEELDQLPVETALFVYHKRIPVFLLPELAQRQFDYRIKEISDGEVHLIIFSNDVGRQ